MSTAQEICAFWLDEVGPKGWYAGGDALDDEIRSRFGATWEAGRRGAHARWLTCAPGALAYLILFDQFPRNMFRGDGRAFSTDGLALAAAKTAIDRGWDRRVAEPARQFFYLPLMHSEKQSDQDRCVRLMLTRMPEGGADQLVHARAHREVIRRYGRFPYRNQALDRRSTGPELAFVDAGGYGAVLRELGA